MKLLLVDDNPILLEQMAKYLRNHDHDVTTALDGQKALEALARQSFEVCFTDLKMPGFSGLELLDIAKGRYPDTRVVIMTAYGTVKGALEALKQGAFDFIHKPFQMSHIMEVLERIEKSQAATPTLVSAASRSYSMGTK